MIDRAQSGEKFVWNDRPHDQRLKEDLAQKKSMLSVLSPVIGRTAEYKKIKKQIRDIEDTLEFNSHFSSSGWFLSESAPSSVIRKAVLKARRNRHNEAEALLKSSVDAGTMRQIAQSTKRHGGWHRKLLLEQAIECAERELYSASTLIVLTQIDGIVQENAGFNPFSNEADFHVWDSIASVDEALPAVLSDISRARRKITIDEIEKPFRNGIIHGKDLNFNNKMVCAKTWWLFRGVLDWISKLDGAKDRYIKYLESIKVPSIAEIQQKIEKNDREKQAILAWRPRKFEDIRLGNIVAEIELDERSHPEFVVSNIITFWRNKQYGRIVPLLRGGRGKSSNARAGWLRSYLHCAEFLSAQIVSVEDSAPAISTVHVDFTSESGRFIQEFLVVFEDDADNCVVRGQPGRWRVNELELSRIAWRLASGTTERELRQ